MQTAKFTGESLETVRESGLKKTILSAKTQLYIIAVYLIT
jgi:hypothetical protein